jgi:hypothetical protein
MFRPLLVAALAVAAVAFCSGPARAVLTSSDGSQAAARLTGSDALQARQYRVPESYVAGPQSIRESVTVWEVTAGTWNGQSLKGLSLVLVSRIADSNSCGSTNSCYISHSASAAQRDALLNAFVTSQTIAPDDAASWHLEPAVIRVEHAGSLVIVRLGRVA